MIQRDDRGNQYLSVDLLEEPTYLARDPQSYFGTTEFEQLKLSIQEHGIRQALTVSGPEGDFWIVEDGMMRLSAARAIGLDKVPVRIVEGVPHDERLERSLEANTTELEQRPVDTAKSVQQLLDLHPGRTLADQARRLHKSPSWLNGILKLASLEGPAADAVNRREVSIQAGHALAKLAKAGVDLSDTDATGRTWLERAKDESAADFAAEVKRATKRDRGKTLKVRTAAEVSEHMALPEHKPCYRAALDWITHQDPESKMAEALCDPDACALDLFGEPEPQANELVRVLLHWGLSYGANAEDLYGYGLTDDVDRCSGELMDALGQADAAECGVERRTWARYVSGKRTCPWDVRTKVLDL